MVLVRHLLGGVLRRQRMRQGRTLRQVSADARVSLGYISEVERGQKEASSELLAAICAALEVPLSTVLHEVSEELATLEQETVPAVESDFALTNDSQDAPTALAKRLETRRIDSERIAGSESHPDVVAAA